MSWYECNVVVVIAIVILVVSLSLPLSLFMYQVKSKYFIHPSRGDSINY